MASATAASKKEEALRMLDAGESQATAAEAVGVDRATVCRWDQKRKGTGKAGAPKASASANGAPSASASARPVVSDETASLRARVRELEEEVSVLRRALGYVARAGVK